MTLIKGEADIEFVYPDGRRELVGKGCNHVNWLALRRFGLANQSGSFNMPTKRDATSSLNGSASRWQLYTGGNDVADNPFQFYYIPDLTVNVAQDYPTYTAGATINDPDLVTFLATIPAPVGSARTIRVIGLTEALNSGISTSSAGAGMLTVLKLTTPCIQPTNVTVVITYRLYLQPATTQNLNNLRYNANVFSLFKSKLKDACNAVNAVDISIPKLDSELISTSYDLSQLTSHSISGNPNATVSEHQYLDNAVQATADTRYYHQNSQRFVGSVDTTSAPYVGVFIKHLAIVGDNLAVNKSNQIGYVYNNVTPDITSPLQNIFGQRNNPPGPFQDLSVNNTATMSGGISLDFSNWVDPGFQKLVRVKCTASGPVGTASYRLEIMNFIGGFIGNRWMPRTAILPQPLVDTEYFQRDANDVIYDELPHSGTMTYRSVDDYRYVVAANCRRIKDGITVYDILKGQRICLRAAQGLAVTAVSDVEVSNGYIFVTCADTGLWRIAPDLTTIEHVPSPISVEKAYQICVKHDAAQTLWVLYEGGVFQLANPSDSLGILTWNPYAFTYAGITNNNWANVSAMIVDPDYMGASDHFLFITGTLTGGSTTGSNRLGFVWWDTANATAVNPTASGVAFYGMTWTLANLLYLSDTIRCSEGNWIIPETSSSVLSVNGSGTDSNTAYIASFGQNDLTAKYFTYPNHFPRYVPATINGIKGFMSVSSNDHICRGSSCFIANTSFAAMPNGHSINVSSAYVEFMFLQGSTDYSASVQTDFSSGTISKPLVYLPSSNMLFVNEGELSHYGVVPFMLQPSHARYAAYKDAFWHSYGWDGSDWVLNEPSNKLTHATSDTISVLDNANIAFVNGGAGVSFVTGEWFSTVIGRGLMKDNGTSYSYNFSFTTFNAERITLNEAVPQTPLGLLTNEPITFQANDVTTSNSTAMEKTLVQNKGVVSILSSSGGQGSDDIYVSDQLIPASTDFEITFKYMEHQSDVDGSFAPDFGIASYSGGTYTWGLRFRYYKSNDTLRVYNNTTLLASIANPTIGKVCKITRVGATINAYYDGTIVAGTTITNSSQYVVRCSVGGFYYVGFYDMRITYTEARRVLRVGSATVPLSGQYHSKFSALTHNGLSKDLRVFLGSGTPLEAVLDYTPSPVTLVGTGNVKVAPAAGWLIFHDSETTNPVTGFATAQYIPF